mmetsp:Transcript_23856/g.77033  ORF Transcript_23856/g.77033 Transcript_23856/m.77033 type:complete len:271 (-) Transcript_23856:301-1113(-)
MRSTTRLAARLRPARRPAARRRSAPRRSCRSTSRPRRARAADRHRPTRPACFPHPAAIGHRRCASPPPAAASAPLPRTAARRSHRAPTSAPAAYHPRRSSSTWTPTARTSPPPSRQPLMTRAAAVRTAVPRCCQRPPTMPAHTAGATAAPRPWARTNSPGRTRRWSASRLLRRSTLTLTHQRTRPRELDRQSRPVPAPRAPVACTRLPAPPCRRAIRLLGDTTGRSLPRRSGDAPTTASQMGRTPGPWCLGCQCARPPARPPAPPWPAAA